MSGTHDAGRELSAPPLQARGPPERYIHSVTLAAIVTAALFAILPALGPWTVYGFAPTRNQAFVQSLIAEIKMPGPIHLALGLSGVVTFPSFHVVLAVSSAIALWSFKRTRYPVALIAAAICISTVTTGWHYVIDGIGGLGVVVVAHYAASFALFEPKVTRMRSRFREQQDKDGQNRGVPVSATGCHGRPATDRACLPKSAGLLRPES